MPIVEQTLDLKPKQEVSFSTTVHGSVRSGVFSILIIDFQGHVVGLDSGTFWYPENGERRRSKEELWDWATRKPPVPAPTEQDNLRMAATNLNAQRGELFRKKDLAGVAALYTSDATYIELLPGFEVIRGRAQIQAHLKDIMAANATDIIPNITSAQMTGNGVMLAGGDYSLVVKGGKKIFGHFFQILRQEGGTWRIAMHAFARPEPVTSVEASEYKNGR